MIRAVVFDCFGVLVSDGWLPFKKKYFGHDKQLVQEATDLNKQVDSGLASYQDFLHKIAELAQVSLDKARHAFEDNVPDEELFAYIRNELKPRHKIGMLSNAGGNWLNDMFQPDQVRLFDAVALSYETGFVKPDRRAYETIASRLGVTLEECVLVDDQERYCTAAHEFGMSAIWYRGDVEMLRAELEKLLN